MFFFFRYLYFPAKVIASFGVIVFGDLLIGITALFSAILGYMLISPIERWFRKQIDRFRPKWDAAIIRLHSRIYSQPPSA